MYGVHDSHITCGRCGYNLTGVTIGGSCPECGVPVDVSIMGGREGGRSNGAATASMVLGILSMTICMPLGIVALLMGYRAQSEMAVGGYQRSSQTQAKAGIIMGWISLAIIAVYAVLFFVYATRQGLW